MSGPSRRIRLTLPVSVAADRVLEVMRRQDNRLYLRGEVFWSPNAYANGDLLSVLRGYGFGVPADAANAHGQAVSTLQLVGMAEGAGANIHAHAVVTSGGRSLARSENPWPVKMELSEAFFANGTPKTAEAIPTCGQLVDAIQAFAMPTQGLVFGHGQALGEFAGHLFSCGPADAEEALGHVRGYLVGGLAPGSDAGLALVLINNNTIPSSMHAEALHPESMRMIATSQISTSCSAETMNAYSVTFYSGHFSYKETILEGESCPDPITTGNMVTATKDPTVSHTFEQNGWTRTEGGEAEPDILLNIAEDLVLYPAFEASIRYYTVKFYDGDVLVDTVLTPYGGTAETDYMKEGYNMVTWVPSNECITGDTECYGQFGLFTFELASWAEISEISRSGKAADTFSIGDKKSIELTNGHTCVVEIVGFDHDELSDGSGEKAGISVVCCRLPYIGVSHTQGIPSSYTKNKSYGYAAYSYPSAERSWYVNTLYPTLIPSDLRNVIRQVNKEYYLVKTDNYNNVTKSVQVTAEYCWPPSPTELGLNRITDNAFYLSKTYPTGRTYQRFKGNSEEYATIDDYLAEFPLPVIDLTGEHASYIIPRDGGNYGFQDGRLWLAFNPIATSTVTAYPRIGFCI